MPLGALRRCPEFDSVLQVLYVPGGPGLEPESVAWLTCAGVPSISTRQRYSATSIAIGQDVMMPARAPCLGACNFESLSFPHSLDPTRPAADSKAAGPRALARD